MANEIKIILADDHPVVRQGLRQALEAESELRVVGEAGDGCVALELIEKQQPDIAILDVDMPKLDGFAVARAVRQHDLAVRLIFLTIHREEDLFNESVGLGARGYVLKDSAMTDIVGAVKVVAAGQHYASPALTGYLFNRNRQAAAPAAEKHALQDLTPAERRVLALIAEYKTSKEIAEELSVSPRTVETHRANISDKLEIHGSHALMKFALAHKSQLS